MQYCFQNRKGSVFPSDASLEITLSKLSCKKVGSTVSYTGEEVIKMLGKFHKPFVIGDETLFGNGSMILKPDSDFTRSSLVALCNSWARMVGIQDSNIEVDHAGRWSSSEVHDSIFPKKSRGKMKLASPLRVLTHFSSSSNTEKKIWNVSPNLFTTQCRWSKSI